MVRDMVFVGLCRDELPSNDDRPEGCEVDIEGPLVEGVTGVTEDGVMGVAGLPVFSRSFSFFRFSTVDWRTEHRTC